MGNVSCCQCVIREFRKVFLGQTKHSDFFGAVFLGG